MKYYETQQIDTGVMYEPRVEMKMTKGVGICHTK